MNRQEEANRGAKEAKEAQNPDPHSLFPCPPGLRDEVLAAAAALAWLPYPSCPTTDWQEISGERAWRVFVATAAAGALVTMLAWLRGVTTQ